MGLALPQRRRAPFYAVAEGGCAITVESTPVTRASLAAGDLVVLPGGAAHTLAAGAAAATIPLEQFVARHPMDERGHLKALDGSGPRTCLIGGFFELERNPEPLAAVLPPMIHLAGHDPDVSTWLEPMLGCARIC